MGQAQENSGHLLEPVYISCGAHVAAIDPATGTEYWRSKLPKSTYGLISLFVQGDLIIAGSYGRIYGLDRWTGEIRWTNELEGMGYYNILITSESASLGQGGMQAGVATVAAQQAAAASAAAASG
jgi:outer membrane protein assembly factor BamB